MFFNLDLKIDIFGTNGRSWEFIQVCGIIMKENDYFLLPPSISISWASAVFIAGLWVWRNATTLVAFRQALEQLSHWDFNQNNFWKWQDFEVEWGHSGTKLATGEDSCSKGTIHYTCNTEKSNLQHGKVQWNGHSTQNFKLETWEHPPFPRSLTWTWSDNNMVVHR